MTGARDMLAELRAFAARVESLPPAPSALRVGPYVAGILARSSARNTGLRLPTQLPLGILIVTDDAYRPGEWRLLDHDGQPMAQGNLWPPDLPVIESDLLPDNVHAMVFNPPQVGPLPTGPCVVVRRIEVSA